MNITETAKLLIELRDNAVSSEWEYGYGYGDENNIIGHGVEGNIICVAPKDMAESYKNWKRNSEFIIYCGNNAKKIAEETIKLKEEVDELKKKNKALSDNLKGKGFGPTVETVELKVENCDGCKSLDAEGVNGSKCRIAGVRSQFIYFDKESNLHVTPVWCPLK